MRVARLGVSRTVFPRRYREDVVVRELGALFASDAYRARAAAVGAEVRAEDGPRVACEALERLLGEAPTVQRT